MDKPKVLLEVSSLLNELSYRGIGNQTYSFLLEFLHSKEFTWVLCGTGTKEDLKRRFTSQDSLLIEGLEFYPFKKPGLLGKLFPGSFIGGQIEKAISTSKAELFVNFNNAGYVSKKIPSIDFIADLIPLKLNKFSQKNALANWWKKQVFLKAFARVKTFASKVVTISEFSKNDLVSAGIPADKIVVIPLALSLDYMRSLALVEKSENYVNLQRKVLGIYNLTQPYICYFGGLEANKNVDAVLRSFQLISEKYPDLKLVIGGGEFKLGWDHKPKPLNERAQKLFQLTADLKLQHRVIFTGFVKPEHMPVIIKSAEVFIHLSTYEGFGLNVLEAQASSVPVVAANASTYPEVLGDGALLVDPIDYTAVAENLQSVLGSDSSSLKLRKQLIEKGLANIKRFSWERAAGQAYGLFNHLLSNNQTLSTGARTVEDSLKDRRMVVLASYFFPFMGGMEAVALDYSKFAVKNGMKVTVITSNEKDGSKSSQATETKDGVDIIRLPRQGRNYYLFWLKGLLAQLKNLQPEVIQIHGIGNLGFDLAVLYFKLRQPKHLRPIVICTPHGPFMSKPEKGVRWIFKQIMTVFIASYAKKLFSVVIAVNPQQKNWITKLYRIPLERIWTFPPVIGGNRKTFPELAKLKKDNELLITSFGRLVDYKGYPDLVTAFSLLNSVNGTKLVIAGATSPYVEDLKNLIRQSPRREDIELRENLSEEEKRKLLEETSIFVFASQWEAFGIVAAEAMRDGNAIIATTTEGGKTLVEVGENGMLFNYGDYQKLTEHLNTLILDNALLKKMQQRSYDLAGQYFADTVEQSFIAKMSELINSAK